MVTVAARLRKLEAPWRLKLGFYTYEPEPLWPLLADLAEAAEALLDEDAGPPPNRYIETDAEEALVAALARVADQLDHEEEGG